MLSKPILITFYHIITVIFVTYFHHKYYTKKIKYYSNWITKYYTGIFDNILLTLNMSITY